MTIDDCQPGLLGQLPSSEENRARRAIETPDERWNRITRRVPRTEPQEPPGWTPTQDGEPCRPRTVEEQKRIVAQRRTEQAQHQIDDARAEPTSAEIEAELQDAQADRRARPLSIDPTPPDTVTLSGAKLTAYRQLEAAAAAAHDAQQAMATTGVALREAIQAMCAAIAPGAK